MFPKSASAHDSGAGAPLGAPDDLVNALLGPLDAGHRVAVRADGPVSASAFRARVNAWKARLSAIGAGDIALHDPDAVEFAAALLAAWRTGRCVHVPGDVQPASVAALRRAGLHLVGAFPEGETDDEATRMLPPEAAPPRPADTALVLYTSGSTGAPLAVPKRLAQLLAECDALERCFGDRLGDSEVVGTVPHHHIYGLLFRILWPLRARRPFHAHALRYPEDIVATVRGQRTTLVSGPAHLKRLPPDLPWEAVRPDVVAVFSSGGPLPDEELVAARRHLGQAPIEVYGSSETGGIAWRQRTDDVDASWRPLPGVQVGVQDGHLTVASPHLPDASVHVVADRAEALAPDRFRLLGRADRIAKVEGKRVSLSAVEAALTRSPLVAQARVLLLADDARDALGAAVVPSAQGWRLLFDEGPAALRTQLTQSLAASFERTLWPRRWRWLDELPENAVGKIPEAAVAGLFAPGGLRLPSGLVEVTGPGQVTCTLHVSRALACFDGHFDGLPVLPGVAQVDWAIAFGRRHLAIRDPFAQLEAVKFHRLHRPGPPLTLQLEWHPDRRLLAFRTTSAQGTHASGRVLFKEP